VIRSIIFLVVIMATVSSFGHLSYGCDKCTSPVNCLIGRSKIYGPSYNAIFVGGKETATPYSDIEDALNSLDELQRAGICSRDPEGPCSIGRSKIYGDGYNTVLVNGKEVATPYSDIEDVVDALAKLQKAGICDGDCSSK